MTLLDHALVSRSGCSQERGQDQADARKRGFKGNKSTLPSKPCLVCGKSMAWRKAWAKNWQEVKYCSDKCRRNKISENV